MARKPRKGNVDAVKALLTHLGEHRDFRRSKPERAFIMWYALARFGRGVEPEIVDGARDGGVDALVEQGDTMTVIQSKLSSGSSASKVTRNEIAGFERVADHLSGESDEDEFSDWVDSVRKELKPPFRRIRRKVSNGDMRLRCVFVTTKVTAVRDVHEIEVEDLDRIAALWYLYEEGFTPPSDSIEVQLESHWQFSSDDGRFKTYVGLADVQSFLALMDEDINERLFAQNVRTDLRSRVNKGIRATYETQPKEFWLGNNGIYIICNKVTISGNVATLTFPSIINGSQTLHSIHTSKKRNPCKVLVRILELDVHDDQKLLSEIIRRTNMQNSMKIMNLHAHDPLQLNVASHLDQYKIFYERREKEWANEKKRLLTGYLNIQMKELAQWLSAFHHKVGIGRAKTGVGELFQSPRYEELFCGFERNTSSLAYRQLAPAVWSGLLVKALARQTEKPWKGFIRNANLLLVRVLSEAIMETRNAYATVDDLLKKHELGRYDMPPELRKKLLGIITEARRMQREWEKDDPALTFPQVFKQDDLIDKVYKKLCGKVVRRELSKIIATKSDRIA
ncbi:MAG: AIPR family protein [Candidatus Eisenbacteria bacterium]